MATLADVAKWVGTPAEILEVFYSGVGAAESDHFRLLGNVPEAKYDSVVEGLQVNDKPLPLATQGGLILIGRICRSLCGTDPTARARSEEAWETVSKIADSARQAADSAAAAARSVQGDGDLVCLREVISQAATNSIPKLGPEDLKAHYERFRGIFNRDPDPEEEASVEQLTGLHNLIKRDVCPYVDFAVWEPYQHRLQKRMKLQGHTFGEGGVLRPVEMKGPADFKTWRESYQVFATAALGFGMVSLGALTDYRKRIEGYYADYGEQMWPLLYQADVRCRSEHLERVRRRLEVGMAAAKAQGVTRCQEFDPDRPWEGVWKAAAADGEFWRKQFEEKAFLMRLHLASPGTAVTGDAPVQGRSGPGQPSQSKPKKATRPAPEPNSDRPAKFHRVAEGMYTHNRQGKKLCEGFQTGACPYQPGRNWCPSQRDAVHQCSRCLSQMHGAHRPFECQAKPVEPKGRGGKGKGQGKGKGTAGKTHMW